MDDFVRAEALDENKTKAKKENRRGLLMPLAVLVVTLILCFQMFSVVN